MEDVLAVYKRPRDGDCPLVCLDEASLQMMANHRQREEEEAASKKVRRGWEPPAMPLGVRRDNPRFSPNAGASLVWATRNEKCARCA